MAITYREIKGKTIICNEGVYMAFTDKQLKELDDLLLAIKAKQKEGINEDEGLVINLE